MGLNRRETHVVSRIDGDRERSARRGRMRERALDTVAGVMRDVIDPNERQDLARELCTASAMNAAQACGPSATGTHLASLSGQAFSAAEQIQQNAKRRARC
jgi:hypothetical protein